MRPSASPIAKHGERKFAVLLFADLSGYTELCRRLDPEDVAATVQPVMSTMKATVERHGGVVPAVAGDGFMAVFGIPHSDQDVADRAIRTAEALRAIIEESNKAALTFRIPDVHIGIASGEVLVMPSDDAIGWSLIGNPVNLAARLCDAAGPDEVLVDDVTRELVGPTRLDARPREVRVAGVTDQLRVWSLEDVAEEVAPPVAAAPFVNRTDVLRRLDAVADECRVEGTSRVVVVAGEAGMGKTRTLQHWLDGRSDPHVWIWCGATSGSSALARTAAQVAAAAGLSNSAATSGGTDDVGPLREDPFPVAAAAARTLFDQLGAHGGAIVVLDDAHLADPSLLAFLRDLRTRPLPTPVTILATWRTDEVDAPWLPEILLEPLGPDESTELLAATLGAPPPVLLANAVIDKIGGHPLMAVQSAAYLIESGVVDIAEGRCLLRQPAAVNVLPTSLRLFVAARIDRLPTPAKAALQEMSTFGEHVDRRPLERLCGQHVVSQISVLVDRGFLREAESGWRFAHGLVQQVAYGSLPRSVRAELHRRQAEFHRSADTGAWLVHARSWAECVSPGEPDRARAAAHEALSAATAHARAVSATQAAAVHSVARQVEALVTDNKHAFPLDAARLFLIDAQALLEMGRFDEALLAADRALELVPQSEEPEHLLALQARGHALSRLRRYLAARQSLEDALSLAEANNDAVALGRTLRLLGDTYRHTSYDEFVRLTERAYETLAATDDTSGARECACILAYLSSVSVQFGRWRPVAAALVEPDDQRGRLWLARADLEAHHVRCDDRAALAAAREAVRLGRLLDVTDGLADGLAGIARSATARGELTAAVEAAEELRALAVAQANPRMRFVASTELALPLLRAGRTDEALAELEAARTAVANFGANELLAFTLRAGAVARDRGRWDEAAALLAQSRADETDGSLAQLAASVVETAVPVAAAPPPADYVDHLAARCRQVGAPLLAGVADAIAEQRRVSDGETVTVTAAEGDACLEERAIRLDTAALLAGRDRGDATSAWQTAAEAWSRLGNTVFLARAQARSGDGDAAARTLDALQADAAARKWAGQG